MALDKNDGIFRPIIDGVISGKTSQVTGVNEILNNLIGNDNYLKGKKLDNGNYIGTAEDLSNDIKGRLPYVNTIEDLKKQTKYAVGDIVEVLGYYSARDGSHHKRVAKSEDDGSGEQGQNGIWWCVVHSGEVNVSWFGATKINEASVDVENEICTEAEKDSYDAVMRAYKYATTLIIDGLYYVRQGIEMQPNKNLRGLSPIAHFANTKSEYCGFVSNWETLKYSNSLSGVEIKNILICSLKGIAVRRMTSGKTTSIFISNFENLIVYGKIGCFRFSDGTTEQPGGCFETSFQQISVGCKPGGFGFSTTNSATRNYFRRIFDLWNSKYRFQGETMFLNVQGYFQNCNISYTGLLKTYWKSTQPYNRATFEDCNFEYITGTCFDGNNSSVILNNCSYLINSNETYFNIFNGSFVDIIINSSSVKIDGTSTNPDELARFSNITNPNPNIVLNGAIGVQKYHNYKKLDTNSDLIDTSLQGLNIINRRGAELQNFQEGSLSIIDNGIYTEKRVAIKGNGNLIFSIKNTATNYYFNYVRAKIIGRIKNDVVYFEVDCLHNELGNKVSLRVAKNIAPQFNSDYDIGAIFENSELKFYIIENGVTWGSSSLSLSIDVKATCANRGLVFVDYKNTNYNYSQTYNLNKLNTPYHASNMQKLGILDSYHQYLTELHEYEKQQNIQSDTSIMKLNILQPPSIPLEVEEYAKEYNLI